jgi:hypothetical protein
VNWKDFYHPIFKQLCNNKQLDIKNDCDNMIALINQSQASVIMRGNGRVSCLIFDYINYANLKNSFMKQIRLILIMVLGVVVSQIANAQLVLTEPFAGYATGLLGSPGTGDTGGIPGWNTPRLAITVTNGEGSLIGTNLGLIASVGDMVNILDTAGTNANSANTNAEFDMQNGVPNGSYNKFANKVSPYPAFTTTNAADLYTSFLYRFNDNVNFCTNGVSVIIVMNQESGGIQSGADAYWMLFARTNANGTIQVGIAKDVPPLATVAGFVGATNWDPTILTVGQTFFVVVREQIFATNATAYGEEDDLWIDPPTGSLGTNEANVPTPDVSSPVSDGTNDTSTTGPGRFFIVDNGPTANLDELRIDTNWANVTPPFGQCVPAEFTVNPPTNLTQSAEINARLVVDGGYSTSPTFQWQLNKNGDSTWSNISGADQPEYDTPNLQLASDNGNEYRCIDYVDCDNTYATSSVATVTLTAPTVTPPGLILNDNWSSEIRYYPPPVSTNHSVWWTAVTADLDADPGDNGAWSDFNSGMFSTQISNSSSLYLGYFVDETTTNLPVDLAIGTTLTATMNFTPLGFEDFTVNKALNFGLYDYADGGVYVTADGPNLTGSLGNGKGVRGYMLAVDFGTNFSSDTPLTLLTRNGYGDNDLMSASGDYLTIGSGPVGGSYSNTPAFQSTNYILTLSVTRSATNTSVIAASITGGGLNLSYTGVDTNNFGYHRFDSFAIQDNSQYNTCDYFAFTNFNVQVTTASVIAPIPLNEIKASGGTNVILSWANPLFTLQSASLVNGPYNSVPDAISPYTNAFTGSNQFFRLMAPMY